MNTNLALRAAATESTLAAYRFKPFDWKGSHCISLAHTQACVMGHVVPDVPAFKSAIGARRALSKMGVRSTVELLDKWFERRAAPAFAWIGDLVALPSDCDLGGVPDALSAVGIADGQGNVFGWHESNLSEMSAIRCASADIIAAWAL